MKVAVSAFGSGLKSQVSPVFGRCPIFVIVEIKDGKIVDHKDVPNNAARQAGSAGIMSSQQVGNEGAEAVISGAVGPRAFSVLGQFGIKVYKSQGGTVEENALKFAEGSLEEIKTPGEMHFGMGRGRGAGMGRGRSW